MDFLHLRDISSCVSGGNDQFPRSWKQDGLNPPSKIGKITAKKYIATYKVRYLGSRPLSHFIMTKKDQYSIT
jgi:hypothetical protein